MGLTVVFVDKEIKYLICKQIGNTIFQRLNSERQYVRIVFIIGSSLLFYRIINGRNTVIISFVRHFCKIRVSLETRKIFCPSTILRNR